MIALNGPQQPKKSANSSAKQSKKSISKIQLEKIIGYAYNYSSNGQGENVVLLLSRSIGESIRIGDDIEIKVLSIKGAQVRIGIEAPKDVAVHRQEVFERIQRGEPKPKN